MYAIGEREGAGAVVEPVYLYWVLGIGCGVLGTVLGIEYKKARNGQLVSYWCLTGVLLASHWLLTDFSLTSYWTLTGHFLKASFSLLGRGLGAQGGQNAPKTKPK